MTTKEEQDQRPLRCGARHTEAVLKQQTHLPGALGRPLSLQPLHTHRGLLYGCQASRRWDFGMRCRSREE